jgi:xanthine dehydrogenase YagS FAD-binding subunit
METFSYQRAADPEAAIAALAADPRAAFIAGGTELVNWMKEGIQSPRSLVDINDLPLAEIAAGEDGLRLGALARMSDVAAHPAVRRGWPAVAEALELSASPQLRNMASMGGNLLQRTRCPYFRAETALPCNKRTPGSGCAALHGEHRAGAIFGWSEACVATHPSDVAVPLVALDARLRLRGPRGERVLAVADLWRLPGEQPERDTTLDHGELIVAVEVPASPAARRSRYLKVRERSSYEFALVSAAAALDLDDGEGAGRGRIRDARLALGGVAARPWRLPEVEARLRGAPLSLEGLRAAVAEGFGEARPLPGNGFKVELAKRAAVRALAMAGGLA